MNIFFFNIRYRPLVGVHMFHMLQFTVNHSVHTFIEPKNKNGYSLFKRAFAKNWKKKILYTNFYNYFEEQNTSIHVLFLILIKYYDSMKQTIQKVWAIQYVHQKQRFCILHSLNLSIITGICPIFFCINEVKHVFQL